MWHTVPQAYSELVAKWIAANFTLRYTGGMVPDVHHIIAKVSAALCQHAGQGLVWHDRARQGDTHK